jgi:predicted metal-dependent hydrolase
MDSTSSNNFQWIFIFAIVAVAWVAIYYKQSKYPLSYVKSTVDGEQYLVRNLPDKQDAADRLARTRDKLVRLRKYLEQSHKSTPFVANMLKNFDAAPARFSESTPDAQYTSYSVNKGEKIYMCLRQRDAAEQLVNENVLTFVALHEMAHTGTQSIGHTPEFWNHFAWLIKQAERINIYEYTDFAAHPVEYCGVHITDSPTYKQGVKDGIKDEAPV